MKTIFTVIIISWWLLVLYIIIDGIFTSTANIVISITVLIGIVSGFAMQDILKNILGGIMILFAKPYQTGDKIQTGEYYGEVIKIGLHSTRIITPDDSIVNIPNGIIMKKSVLNVNNGQPDCQVAVEIYLPVYTDTEKIRQIAVEAAQVSRYIYLNKPITVLFFNEIKDRKSYLKMRIKAYVMDIRYEFQFRSDLTELVVKELVAKNLIFEEDVG